MPVLVHWLSRCQTDYGYLKINRHYRSEKLPSLLIWDVYHHYQSRFHAYHSLSRCQTNHGLSGISSSLPILISAYLPICLFCIAAHLSITLINLSTCPCPAPLKSHLSTCQCPAPLKSKL